MPSLFGSGPNQAPTNGDLGTLAFQDANAVKITGGEVTAVQKTDTAISETNPSLNLDFANTKSLDPRITFTRNTTATFFDSNGILQTCPVNSARFDHDPITGESKGLLIEEQRTNLLTYSDQFDNAAWTKTRSSITTNTIVAPDGTLTGDKVVEDTTASNTHSVNVVTASLTSGTAYTVSIYAKTDSARVLAITLGGSAYTTSQTVSYTLSGNGTATLLGGSPTSSITAVGNGWYRCSMTATAQVTGTALFVAYLANAATGAGLSYTGDGTSGIYIWGAQLEAGAFPTSYIPTTTAQVTRSADAASITGTNFSSWYRQDEGTVFVDVKTASSTSGGLLTITDTVGGFGNEISTYNNLTWRVQVNNVTQAEFAPVGWIQTAVNKTVFAYKVNDFAGVTNSGAISTDTSGVVPQNISQMFIGKRADGGQTINGTIKRIAYYPKRLSNDELVEMTS